MKQTVAAVLLSALILTAGCATTGPIAPDPFTTLPQKYSQFDMKLAWDTKVSDDGVLVSGVIRSTRWLFAEGLVVWVSVVGPDGKVAGTEGALIAPSVLNLGDQGSFAIRIPVRPQPGSHLAFTYRYNGVDDIEGSAFWIQSFDGGQLTVDN
ncbi:lipoprotein [Geomonas limicola]|uniref:Lipoprotein n=1 Tax=Geomonas limicola TaxID=2740186 RepID=A0A6V8N365_9BACT|nr:hypothetical protein [Geomonas limicola]GFO66946.1 lipoprotein [Geomonas limicola]